MLKISVIVPVYKSEKYIERCIDSILNQTYKNIELILVDDGSPDNSPKICDRYAETDSRVLVIHKENGGVSTARNAGLEIATGDYIAFVDSDDYIEPYMYEKMLDKAVKHNCQVVLCDCVKEYGEYREVYSHNIRAGFYNREQLENEYFPHLLMMENVEYPATISNRLLLWKRELNTSVMRYESGIRYSEDLLFGAKLLYAADSFYYMKNETYYHYVMNPASATHIYAPDKWKDYVLLHSRINDEFGKCADYDFSSQIDLCLLFFVYNAVGDIYSANIEQEEKLSKIKNILNTPRVSEMFRRTNVFSLGVTTKLKIITFMYKHRMGISLLIKYFGRR